MACLSASELQTPKPPGFLVGAPLSCLPLSSTWRSLCAPGWLLTCPSECTQGPALPTGSCAEYLACIPSRCSVHKTQLCSSWNLNQAVTAVTPRPQVKSGLGTVSDSGGCPTAERQGQHLDPGCPAAPPGPSSLKAAVSRKTVIRRVLC